MLDDLYENIGDKVKRLAKVVFAIESIAAIIYALVLMCTDAVLAGLIVLVVGPLVAWVSSWVLYAFGELVEKTVANESHTKNILKILQDKESQNLTGEPTVKANKPRAAHAWLCDNCGKMATQTPCEHCGYMHKNESAPYRCGNCGHLGPYEGRCPKCDSSLKRYNTEQI